MNNNGIKVISILIGLIVVLSVLTGIGYVHKKNNDNQSKRQEQAAPYMEEIERLRAELHEEQGDIEDVVPVSPLVVSYQLGEANGESTIELIAEQGEKYGFEPTIVLDASLEPEKLAEQIALIQDRGWEVMLTASDFDEKWEENIATLQEMLAETELPVTGVYFLRLTEYEEKNVERIRQAGFTGYTIYSKEVIKGYLDGDLVCLEYSLISRQDTVISDRLRLHVVNKTPMLITFNMGAMGAGLPLAEITNDLDSIQIYIENNEQVFSSVTESEETIRYMNQVMDERREQYEKNLQEKNDRINELKELIKGLD